MKSLHSKPFSMSDAKAGAPYCCRDGDEAIIAKWDRRKTSYTIGGYVGISDMPRTWTASGEYRSSEVDHDYDLVMLPIGMIDGKPVFTGDEIEVSIAGGWKAVSAESTWAGTWSDDGKYTRWPAPAKAYPQTLMTDDDLCPLLGPKSWAFEDAKTIASMSIRHAIDAGQVFTHADRDARDLLIAKAVLAAANNARFTIPGEDGIDLLAIIATVPK